MFHKTRNYLMWDKGWPYWRAHEEAAQRMEAEYGLCPPNGPSWLSRIVLSFVVGKIKLPEVKMSPLLRKLFVSLVFGLTAAGAILQAALADGSISSAEWAEILPAFIVAAWGKFSSNTTFVAPSRKGETISGPQ